MAEADTRTAEIINDWFRERLATGAIARNTEAYNQAVAALPDLIARFAPLDAAPAPAPVPVSTPEQPVETPPAPETADHL